MRVNNQTTDPVDWEQNGGTTPDPEEEARLESQEGELNAGASTGPIAPVGLPPYEVHFRSTNVKPEKSAKSPGFMDPNATVTLNSDWTVSVS